MSKKIILKFDNEIYQAIRVAADQEGKTISNFIEFALIHYLSELSFVSDIEMKEILSDSILRMSIRNGINDVDKRNYSIVS